jgi:hypothetical protein
VAALTCTFPRYAANEINGRAGWSFEIFFRYQANCNTRKHCRQGARTPQTDNKNLCANYEFAGVDMNHSTLDQARRSRRDDDRIQFQSYRQKSHGAKVPRCTRQASHDAPMGQPHVNKGWPVLAGAGRRRGRGGRGGLHGALDGRPGVRPALARETKTGERRGHNWPPGTRRPAPGGKPLSSGPGRPARKDAAAAMRQRAASAHDAPREPAWRGRGRGRRAGGANGGRPGWVSWLGVVVVFRGVADAPRLGSAGAGAGRGLQHSSAQLSTVNYKYGNLTPHAARRRSGLPAASQRPPPQSHPPPPAPI